MERWERGGREICFLLYEFFICVWYCCYKQEVSWTESVYKVHLTEWAYQKAYEIPISQLWFLCMCLCSVVRLSVRANWILHFKHENQSQFSFCLNCVMLCELVHAVIGWWWLCSCAYLSSWYCRTCELDVASNLLSQQYIRWWLTIELMLKLHCVFVWTTLAYRCSY